MDMSINTQPAFPLTLCVYDAAQGDLASSSHQARAYGVEAWILEVKALSQVNLSRVDFPFCLRWHGPFGPPDVALDMVDVIKPLLEAGYWVNHGGRPIVLLSQPGWKTPINWLQDLIKEFSASLGRRPIIFCDFHINNDLWHAIDDVIPIAKAGYSAFRCSGSIDLDFRGCIYAANYNNPLAQHYLVPIVPPPLLSQSVDNIESMPLMQNHNPTEYNRLWGQTKAISRLIAYESPSLAVQIITSWKRHRAALIVRTQPNSKINKRTKTPRNIEYSHSSSVLTAKEPESKPTLALAIHGYHLDVLLQMLESDIE
jgi:hypothetical protein